MAELIGNAIKSGNVEVVKFLLNQESVVTDGVVDVAIEVGNDEILGVLLEKLKVTEEQFTKLILDCATVTETVKLACRRYREMRSFDSSLNWLCWNGLMSELIMLNRHVMVGYLLNDYSDLIDGSPEDIPMTMSEAIRNGKVEIVDKLGQTGYRIPVSTIDLEIALKNGHPEMVALIRQQSLKGLTGLMFDSSIVHPFLLSNGYERLAEWVAKNVPQSTSPLFLSGTVTVTCGQCPVTVMQSTTPAVEAVKPGSAIQIQLQSVPLKFTEVDRDEFEAVRIKVSELLNAELATALQGNKTGLIDNLTKYKTVIGSIGNKEV